MNWLNDVKIQSKENSVIMKFIGKLIKPFNGSFMTKYWTTWFGTIYAPVGVDVKNPNILLKHKNIIEHEKVHLADQAKHPILFPLSYVLPPFFFAYGRWYWERRAFLITLSFYETREAKLTQLEKIIDALGGSNYFWTWPKTWMRSWFLNHL